MKIAVLYSVNTAEAQISQKSMKSVTAVMEKMGMDFCTVPFTQNFITDLVKTNADVVFNCMHGKYGEDGYVQAVLNAMQIPYTHSGAVASQIGMNKFLTNSYAKTLGIPVMESCAVSKQNLLEGKYTAEKKSFIKPVNGGSSVATFLVNEGQKLSTAQISEVENFRDGSLFMIEEYFRGIETGIAILNDKPVGSFQVVPEEEFYSFNAKYQSGKTQYLVPAKISAEMESTLSKHAEDLHKVIGCSCLSRVDFLVNADDYRLLEINTHPGFTDLSLVPKVCKYKGIEYGEIIKILIDCAKFEPIA